ncbi:hypothetical protein BWD42_07395 [Sphingobacterium sp. CZ-UAM]|nr:hypothetical protein BWD42_07395 [Sphingobacterium sp. CZ-UAM]
MSHTVKVSAVLFSILFAAGSCRTNDEERIGLGGAATVKVNLLGESFGAPKNSGKKQGAVAMGERVGMQQELTQYDEARFNADYTLVAELSPVSVEPALAKASKRASTETQDLNPGIRYKLVIYKASGEYVTERDYVRGSEASAAELKLDGGQNYTFVAYSIGSPTDLPAITFADAQAKTLATSSLSALQGTADFSYFRKDNMLVEGNTVNLLDIVLDHKFSSITTTIDATATGYNITAADANLAPHFPTATVQLADGIPLSSGQPGAAAISFPTLNQAMVTSTPTLVNASTNTGTLNLSNFVIGPLTQSNQVAFSNLNFTPGAKYKLSLRLNPKDAYLDHNGQKAVRINGLVWMRYNLGAPAIQTNADPDVITNNSFGDYYQFGGKDPVASVLSTSVNANWNASTVRPDNAWNSGTEMAPVKTANDPCPSGFRIPTRREAQLLVDGTVASNLPWFPFPANYTDSKTLTSKRNKSVKMTLPATGDITPKLISAGVYNFPPASVIFGNRGRYGFYHTSYTEQNNTYHIRASTSDILVRTEGNNDLINKFKAYPIRCVAE